MKLITRHGTVDLPCDTNEEIAGTLIKLVDLCLSAETADEQRTRWEHLTFVIGVAARRLRGVE